MGDDEDVEDVRTGQGDVALSRDEFRRRLGERFYDPAFDAVRPELERVIDVAWDGYHRRSDWLGSLARWSRPPTASSATSST